MSWRRHGAVALLGLAACCLVATGTGWERREPAPGEMRTEPWSPTIPRAAHAPHAGVLASAPSAPSAPAERHPDVPVLMYHVIADPPHDAAFPELWVSPRHFAGQMAWLDRAGFTAVTLRDVWAHWHEGASLPARPVVVTFDDGYLSVAQQALPVLVEHGWPAVANLKVGNLDEDAGLAASIGRLVAAGWEIGSHTLTHPDLTTVDDDTLAREVAGSREALRRRFGGAVEFFCYPAGRYDERVVTAVRRAGYLGATTTEPGLASVGEPYSLDRIRVSRSDGVDGFAATMEALGSSP